MAQLSDLKDLLLELSTDSTQCPHLTQRPLTLLDFRVIEPKTQGSWNLSLNLLKMPFLP